MFRCESVVDRAKRSAKERCAELEQLRLAEPVRPFPPGVAPEYGPSGVEEAFEAARSTCPDLWGVAVWDCSSWPCIAVTDLTSKDDEVACGLDLRTGALFIEGVGSARPWVVRSLEPDGRTDRAAFAVRLGQLLSDWSAEVGGEE